MLDSIIKVAGDILATTPGVAIDDVAAIDIPEDGLIWSIDCMIYTTDFVDPVAGASADYLMAAELSFLSTNQFASNDARGELQEIGISFQANSVNAEGGGLGKTSEVRSTNFTKGIPVMAGERIHAHSFSSLANLTGAFRFLLFMESKGGARRSTRRR